MRRSAPYFTVPVVLAALLLTVAACTDRNPAGSAKGPQPELPPSTMSMLTCTVSVRAATLACRPQDPGTGSDVSAALIGGQGSYVQLTSTGVHYDSISTFTANVTLENLTAQALGTADGVTPSADGVRVFFSSGPFATEGTGPVEVANADGEAFFTGAGQKYFRYDGILPPGDTTPAREWRFTVPPSVTRFTFGVYVAAPVRAEGGWVSMSPIAAALRVGATMQMTATSRNLAGSAQDGHPLSWTTSDSSVATVDAEGLVTGVGQGSATVRAAGSGRMGAVEVRVYSPGGTVWPTLHGLEVLGSSVTAGAAGDSVRFHVPYSYEGPMAMTMHVTLRHPSGVQSVCSVFGIERTAGYPELRCGGIFRDGARGGTWRVERIEVAHRVVTYGALLAAGAPAHVYVTSHNEDVTPPALNVLTIRPPTVTAGQTELSISLSATDDGVGPASLADVWVRSQGNPRTGLLAAQVTSQDKTVQYQARWVVPGYYHGGTFVLDSVRVSDGNGNRRAYRTADLAGAGLPTEFTVVSHNPDTIPPTITAFSFSPQTVAGNGADSVAVTLSASEPSGASGVWFLDMEFEKTTDAAQRRRCLLNGSTQVFARTMTCRLAFGAADAGTWRVRYVRAIDFMNQSRVLFTADLQAAGYPAALTVTPP
jgi:hypothetical protein